MRITQVQVEETKDQKYSRSGGMDERVKISEVRWMGWNCRYTQGQME